MTVVYELPAYDPPFPINHGTIAFLFIFAILMAGFVVLIRIFQAEMHRPSLLNKSLKRLRVGYWALILVGAMAFSAGAGLIVKFHNFFSARPPIFAIFANWRISGCKNSKNRRNMK